MKLIIIVSVISISVLFGFFSKIAFFSSDVPDFSNNSKSIYDYSAVSIDGEEVKISDFKGKKIIIVNVASKCGYTYQYDGFQKLNEEFKKNSNNKVRQLLGLNYEYPKIMDVSKKTNNIGIGYQGKNK